MMQHNKRHSGFTLVELLVVVAIITIISSVAIPIMAKGGLFSGNKTAASAGDLFAQLRGAHVLSTTNNTDYAIAYGIAMRDGQLVVDSLYDAASSQEIAVVPGDYLLNYPDLVDLLGDTNDPQAAVLGSTALVRRVTLEELKQVDNTVDNVSLAQYIITMFNTSEYKYGPNVAESFTYNLAQSLFIPVENSHGQFQPLPNDACVLTNHPALLEDINDGDHLVENTGLQGIYIIRYERDVDPNTGRVNFVVDRILPVVNDTDTGDASTANELYRGLPANLNADWKNQFPAHVFSKKGGLDVPSAVTKQRLTISVGLYPDAAYYERFIFDEDFDRLVTVAEFTGSGVNDDLVSLDTDIEIYVATGRVKVVNDVQ